MLRGQAGNPAREVSAETPLFADSSEAPGIACPNPRQFRFELLALAWLEVVSSSFELVKNALTHHLPFETSQSLLQTLTGK